jgi:hypothetical protein
VTFCLLHRFGCDGFGESKKFKIRLMAEFKKQLELSLKVNQVKVLCQVIYYVKKFEIAGKVLPSVIFVGDKNECFVIHTNDIFGYLSMDLDWNIAPSDAHTNIKLVSMLMDDEKIAPHVLYIYNPQNEFKEIVNKIKEINKGVNVPRTLTEKNIDKVYNFFTDKITLKRLGKKIAPNDSVNLFAHIMLHPDSVMLNTHTKQLFTGMFKEPLSVSNVESYNSFVTEFSRTYTPKQKHIFTAILDRLIEDTTRRKQGEFFTPTIWVDKAHEYIASVFGEDWKEKYIVWDPAWGTGNLTRDHKFKELYVSTLNQSDIDTTDQMGYNPEAVKFQYDFLNDDYEKLPVGLKRSIESGKKIIVLMNPPYARSNGDGKVGTVGKDVAKTMISEEMKINKWGSSSSQLYSQFLYRIYMLNEKSNIEIAFFSKSVYKTGETFKNFRLNFYKKYCYSKGFLFSASHFSDTADSWGVDFSIWKNGVETKNSLPINVLNYTLDGFVEICTKNLYNMDYNQKASDWVKRKLKGKRTVDKPQMTSALKVKNSSGDLIVENSLGCFMNKMNSVMVNDTWVSLFSSSSSKGNGGVSILPENLLEATTLFAARKTISQNWINDKDEYFEPNTNHLEFETFTKDSIVFSLFNSSSEQSSLRQITYKDQLWDIKNQFFWMSKEEMINLANNNNYTELYNDVRTDTDRYIHILLFGTEGIYNQLSISLWYANIPTIRRFNRITQSP